MRTYNIQGQGCLVMAIILTVLFMILTFFGRILFTTPLGIALLIGFGIKYLIDSTRKAKISKQRYQEFTNESGFNYSKSEADSGSTGYNDPSSFSRDDYVNAEEVTDYKEIDK